jgi:Ca-activated chloride channel family protein
VTLGFERPFLIAAAFLFAAAVPVVSRLYRDPFALNTPLGPPGGIPFRAPMRVDFLIKILFALETAGVFILLIAAAGPFMRTSETVWLNRGADILFVIDISPSMAGIDMNGRSRFDEARNLVSVFARNRPSDAIGLVAVGDDAALLVPPTVDRDALSLRLESLRIGELGDGTALGMGLAMAALHIRRSGASRRAVVLITDGENNAGAVHPETAAGILGSAGISLWVIGVGSAGVIPIEYTDPITRIHRTGFLDSRFDPESLIAIAKKGGGVYIAAPSAAAFSAAFTRLNEGEMAIRRSGTLSRTSAVHGPLIAAALVFLCAARFVRRHILGAFL